jgi:hypothetical protein
MLVETLIETFLTEEKEPKVHQNRGAFHLVLATDPGVPVPRCGDPLRVKVNSHSQLRREKTGTGLDWRAWFH